MLMHGITKVLLLLILEDIKKCIEHYDKAIEIDPNHVDAWNNKGLSSPIILEDMRKS